jgi:small subunit ribosomal protein S16
MRVPAVMRLKRIGAKKAPAYRVVVTDRKNRRDGEAVEEVGFYNPVSNPPVVDFKKERVEYWLSVGVVPSETVGNLLKQAGFAGAKASA